MTILERYKYLRAMKRRYGQADKNNKRKLLDEMEAVTGMRLKTLVRSVSSSLKRKPRRPERRQTYGPHVDDAPAGANGGCQYLHSAASAPA